MATTYNGTDGDDVVKQANDSKHDWFNIYTIGGDDTIKLTLGATYVEAGDDNDTVKSSIENNNDIKLGDGDDSYTGNGFSNRNNHYDRVWGGNGDDTFTVATAVSDYYGGDGNDTYNSAGYWNYFDGGSGRDTVSYQRQDTDDFLSGRGVKVNLLDHYATTGGGREEVLYNVEDLIGTSADDTLGGTNGKNNIQGMDGFDILHGREGDDKLYGGHGGDNLFGDDGNDKLYGQRGTDLLDGGDGSDTFVFQSVKDSVVGDNRDVIDDFSHSQGDKIDVSAIGHFTFIGNDHFSGTPDELRFAGHIVQGDVDGDGKTDFEIKVANVDSLQSSDFIL